MANFPALQQCADAVAGRTIAVKFGSPGDPPLMLLADRRSVAACKLVLNVCWLPDEVLAGHCGRGVGHDVELELGIGQAGKPAFGCPSSDPFSPAITVAVGRG